MFSGRKEFSFIIIMINNSCEHFVEELKDYKTSKGTVQFPLDKPLPAQLIKDMIAYRREMILKDKL